MYRNHWVAAVQVYNTEDWNDRERKRERERESERDIVRYIYIYKEGERDRRCSILVVRVNGSYNNM